MNAPGIHFFYDFYPVMVEYTHKKTSFLQFLTSVFAVIGGIFTISRCVGFGGWLIVYMRVQGYLWHGTARHGPYQTSILDTFKNSIIDSLIYQSARAIKKLA